MAFNAAKVLTAHGKRKRGGEAVCLEEFFWFGGNFLYCQTKKKQRFIYYINRILLKVGRRLFYTKFIKIKHGKLLSHDQNKFAVILNLGIQ